MRPMPDEKAESSAKKKRSKKPAPDPNASGPIPVSAENAIGTLGETRETESLGGDPNSPADRALESALQRALSWN